MNSMKQTGCIHVVPSGLCTPLYKHSMGSRPWLYHFVLSGLSTAATRRHVVAMGASPCPLFCNVATTKAHQRWTLGPQPAFPVRRFGFEHLLC